MVTVESKLTRAQSLFQEAREDKRASNRLRRRAQSKMNLATKFKRELEAMGITVVFEDSPIDHRCHRGGTSDKADRSA